MSASLVSKVLVLDNSAVHSEVIRDFCERHGLVAHRVREDHLMAVLGSNIDLGAIFYAGSYGATPEENATIARRIHFLRPELPLIFRGDTEEAIEAMDPSLRRICCATYTTDTISALKKVIDDHIFSLVYPNALVRGISEMTEAVFSARFKPFEVRWETPYLVRDRMIFGEVFSLIPLESHWCRGYMMLQAEEAALLDFLRGSGVNAEAQFRDVNCLLGEMTNLIWGAFKNRYFSDDVLVSRGQIQVPLVVNHLHKYISFGTENPQLCFRYTLTEPDSAKTMTFHQRFIFNLTWTPEEFREIVHDDATMIDAGALELF